MNMNNPWMGTIKGKCLKLGDNVSVDDIIASHYTRDPQAMKDPEKLRKHFFETIKPGMGELLEEGLVIVGGKNFGCGSSREHAVRLLKAYGVPVIMAVSFARSFYRNCINLGMPVLEGDDFFQLNDGEEIGVNVLSGEISNYSNIHIKVPPLPDFIKDIGQAGGLVPYILTQGINQFFD